MHTLQADPEGRHHRLDELTPGLLFRVIGTVDYTRFQVSHKGNPYLMIQLSSPDGTSMKALAFNTNFGSYRTACAATMEPGRRVCLKIKAADSNTGFVNGVEVARRV